MKAGATPSKAYDLLKEATKTNVDGLTRDGDHVIATRDSNLDYFSESDIECLNQIIFLWGKAPNWSRGNAAHDDAWEKAWAKKGNKDSVDIPVVNIANLFDDSEDLIKYLSNSDSE
jgi:hypothetical protein